MSMDNDLIRRGAVEAALRNNVLIDMTPRLEEAIAKIPTAYDIDDVVAALQRKADHCRFLSQDPECKGNTTRYLLNEQAAAYEDAIRIAKAGGEINE